MQRVIRLEAGELLWIEQGQASWLVPFVEGGGTKRTDDPAARHHKQIRLGEMAR